MTLVFASASFILVYTLNVANVVVEEDGFDANSKWTILHGRRTEAPTSIVPRVPKPISFQPDELWTGSSLEVNSLGINSILINDPRKYNLKPGEPIPGTSTEKFALSMFHQLHCLVCSANSL